jgi:hypothetical protein
MRCRPREWDVAARYELAILRIGVKAVWPSAAPEITRSYQVVEDPGVIEVQALTRAIG